MGRQARNSAQGFGDRVFAVSRELMAIGHGIGEHDLARQERDLGKIVVRAEHVKIVQMTHERRVARAARIGEFGARPAGQRHEFLRRRLSDRHARDAGDFGRTMKASARKERTGSSTAGRRNGQTAVSIWISGRRAPLPAPSARRASDTSYSGLHCRILDALDFPGRTKTPLPAGLGSSPRAAAAVPAG